MAIETCAEYWVENCKKDLTHNIIPFWLKYGLDKVYSGIYTCVARNGQLIDTTKSVWFQKCLHLYYMFCILSNFTIDKDENV